MGLHPFVYVGKHMAGLVMDIPGCLAVDRAHAPQDFPVATPRVDVLPMDTI